MPRLKVLLSCYACGPGRGSEPGIGWNVAREMARHHDVWVVTEEESREGLEAELRARPIPSLRVVYHALPVSPQQLGHQLHYHFWQATLHPTVRDLHRCVGFDLTHHVTYERYWAPSPLARLDAPFIWGPVGGGESAPWPFWRGLGVRGFVAEAVRVAARWAGEHTPSVRRTARLAHTAVATTPETAARLSHLRAARIRTFSVIGLNDEDADVLGAVPPVGPGPARFISIGRLLHWKGFDLGLRAFAKADLPGAEYWVVGDGPAQARLEALAAELGLGDRARFFGRQTRQETLRLLGESLALVHPSLHDSGGWVCLEAQAAGRPVLHLDLGGPAFMVSSEAGVRVPARHPDQSIADLAAAMRTLDGDRERARDMGRAGRAHARTELSLAHKMDALAAFYQEVAHAPAHAKIRPAPTPPEASHVPALP